MVPIAGLPSRTVLFCARRMPGASTGGIERWSQEVHDALQDRFRVRTLGHDGPRWAEPLYLAGLASRIRRARRDDPLAVADGSDASLAWGLARAGGPSVLRVVGLDILYGNRLYQRLLARAIPNVSAFVACSRPTAGLLTTWQVPADRIHVVHPPAEAPPGFRRSTEPGRVVMTGRLVQRKGAVEFVETIWPRVLAARPDARLDVVGDGPEAVRMRRAAQAQPNVHWHGRLAQPALEGLLAKADVTVMNNRHVAGDWEGFGMVAAESAVRGVPVVARAVDGVVDAVVPDETGVLVPQGDDMAEAVLAAMDRSWDRRTVADAARRHFGRQRHAKEYLAVHEAVADGAA